MLGMTQDQHDILYLNVVAGINSDWEDLRRHLAEMDTKVAYLRIFEMSLSPACTQPLWGISVYKHQAAAFPLPNDPYARLDFETFRSWMAIYEQVMRDQGLIGRRLRSIVGLEDREAEA